ncbi:hyccin isoform X4 [Orussus abietinus]|uniref:hyccin isoform X4 n=1 Tax=Orussus abietinus TaxID=222816 RepID=UPI000C716207|nr:hyccin isoform X4 [Orussus abietinus]
MTESLVMEWLADCADLSPSELHTFASTLSEDNEIVRALYVLLEERSKYSQLIDTVCNQLFSFYRSRELELQRFTLQFLPTLIYIYLNAIAHGDIKNCRTVETLLIGLYNLEVVDKSGQPKVVSFRLPSLAMSSVYHEPMSLAPASLTESAVRRFEECNSKLVCWGPVQQVEILNAQNRLKVMTGLLFIYNQQLGFIPKSALEQLCRVATKLVTQGFMKPGHHQRSSYGSESSFVPRLLPRIPVSSQFLLEFLHAVYFAMYNDCWYIAGQAVEDVHNRACYEGYPDVMLVTNAIRNSSSSGPSGITGDSSMGVGVALSPATGGAPVSKSMITNASFRTKKLPDDLDEALFDSVETPRSAHQQEHESENQTTSTTAVKQRGWRSWKPSLRGTVDEEEAARSSPSSKESSRRESTTSIQGSPMRSSPKRSRDQSKKTSTDCSGNILEEVRRRPRRGSKEGNESMEENRSSAGARLYRLLEERALGEAIIEPSDDPYIPAGRQTGHRASSTMTADT